MIKITCQKDVCGLYIYHPATLCPCVTSITVAGNSSHYVGYPKIVGYREKLKPHDAHLRVKRLN